MSPEDVESVRSLIAESPLHKGIVLRYGQDVVPNGVARNKLACAIEPSLDFSKEDGAFYTVIMVDPDAPSPKNPKMGPWLHWIVHNITKENPKGSTGCLYFGPSPPRGIHRYVTLIYKQKDGTIDHSKCDYTLRNNFKFGDFVKKNKLDLIHVHYYTVDSGKTE
uniref:Phosphatidylethanolamine-binding protein 1 n=1 Tax=Fundulus heteroclitus TaxID=8078 RepID=A0A146ZDP1_FUNHE